MPSVDGRPDRGTVIRFVERAAPRGAPAPNEALGPVPSALPLPGLAPVGAAFDGTGVAAYADHWVSNVFDRERFLATLAVTGCARSAGVSCLD